MKKHIIYILFALLLVNCGSDSGGPVDPGNTGPTIEELINSGWNSFSQNRFESAKQYFDRALVIESTNSSANLGKGWSLLLMGSNHIQVSISALEKAMYDVTCEADCRAGIITAKFIQQKYDEIPSLVDYLLSDNSKYEFSFKHDINWQDMALMKAQSLYFIRRYAEAWRTVKQLTSEYNFIDPQASETWIIEQEHFFSFEAVLSRIINLLSESYK